MDILEQIQNFANKNPDHPAFQNNQEPLTYGQLESYSNRLAAYLRNHIPNDGKPIVVYGHKSPYMIVSFLASVKSGHAYVPLDIGNPKQRIQDIIHSVNPAIILTTMPLPIKGRNILHFEELMEIAQSYDGQIGPADAVSLFDPFYIIFTSGSTGKPKGVQISRSNLNSFITWGNNTLIGDLEGEGIFLNQAPFSFDLSVMDLYIGLSSGSTVYAVDKAVQSDYQKLFSSLKASNITIWVSTPSFADLCLTDRHFNQVLCPDLKKFLFCGEALSNKTAKLLMDRFPDVKIVNTYGPTEATCACTSIEITREMVKSKEPLPVGIPKSDVFITIEDENRHILDDGQEGELVITGASVSQGYFQNDELTREKFNLTHHGYSYRTGDKAFYRDGCLHFVGRMDFQIKLNGYRIELGDIENNLIAIKGVDSAAAIPMKKRDKIRSISAFVTIGENFRWTAEELREVLKEGLPDYMIPKKIIILDQMPLTANGKVDKKKLEAEYQ